MLNGDPLVVNVFDEAKSVCSDIYGTDFDLFAGWLLVVSLFGGTYLSGFAVNVLGHITDVPCISSLVLAILWTT